MFESADREGPMIVPAHEKTVRVPEQRLCDGCRHLKSRTNKIDGFFGEGRDWCYHPAHALAEEGELPVTLSPRVIRVWTLSSPLLCSTPSWCPFLSDEPGEEPSPAYVDQG